jgi:uncharacterized membrane protein
LVLAHLVLIALLAAPVDSLRPVVAAPLIAGPRVDGATLGVRQPQDTIRRRPRPKAIEYSEWYERRATIHRIASWATIPLFAAEVVTGQELFKNGPEAADWAKDGHGIVVASLGGLFALNTVTGGWNLWAARKDPGGRKWRTAHAILMLVADAGFAYTGYLADDAEESAVKRQQHKNMAITSSSVALVSYLMMLKPLRRD